MDYCCTCSFSLHYHTVAKSQPNPTAAWILHAWLPDLIYARILTGFLCPGPGVDTSLSAPQLKCTLQHLSPIRQPYMGKSWQTFGLLMPEQRWAQHSANNILREDWKPLSDAAFEIVFSILPEMYLLLYDTYQEQTVLLHIITNASEILTKADWNERQMKNPPSGSLCSSVKHSSDEASFSLFVVSH